MSSWFAYISMSSQCITALFIHVDGHDRSRGAVCVKRYEENLVWLEPKYVQCIHDECFYVSLACIIVCYVCSMFFSGASRDDLTPIDPDDENASSLQCSFHGPSATAFVYGTVPEEGRKV